MPRLIYGTAWKGDRTEDLVYAALRAGFRAVDTAADPQHYDEAAVGRAIRRAVRDGIVRREELFVQTKLAVGLDREDVFSSATSSALPSSPPSLREQVGASVRTSLARLGSPIDCLVLHRVPRGRERARAVWRALEDWVLPSSPSPSREGPEPVHVRRLGVSGISLLAFEDLFPAAAAADDTYFPTTPSISSGDDNDDSSICVRVRVHPAVVQNAFHRRAAHFEDELRRELGRRGVAFQAYHVLTGNRQELQLPLGRACHHRDDAGNNGGGDENKNSSSSAAAPIHHPLAPREARNDSRSEDTSSGGGGSTAASAVHDLARWSGVSPAAATYALVLGLGGTAVLDGTASEARMAQDVRELAVLGALAANADAKEGGRAVWEGCLRKFAREVSQEVEEEGEGQQ